MAAVEFDACAFAEEILRPARELLVAETPAHLAVLMFQDAIHRGVQAVQGATTFHAREKLRYELTKALRAGREKVLDVVRDPGEHDVMAEETLEAVRATNAVAMAFL